MLKRILTAISLAMVPALMPLPGAAQPAPPMAPAPLDAAARQQVVTALATALRDRYVFPDIGEQAATRITAALTAGEYDQFTDGAAFAARLHADIEAIARDKHLRVRSMIGPPPPGAAQPQRPEPPRAEAGVVRADRLAGGIGYIEVTGFPPPEAFSPAIDRAMQSLAGSTALIIDVRRNGGGAPPSVSQLVSYLLPSDNPVHINDIVRRVAGTQTFERDSFHSTPTAVSFAEVPVYVLISNYTFSGGEEFAYDVQALKRATLIGEITGGGANPTGPVQLAAGLAASIPTGRAENPVTKSNWEGVGVVPEIAVPAADALKVALERLGQPAAADIAAASQERLFFPRSVPLAGTEAALRKLLDAVAKGEPDDSFMAPQFVQMALMQLPMIQQRLAPLGELRSIAFREVDNMGGDSFDVTFANGVVRMAVILDADGKIAGSGMQMAPPPGP